MTDSKSIYTDHATGGTEDTYLVYVLYRDGDTPHYVGATQDVRRPYTKSHKARQDHNVTSVEIVQECLSLEDASILEDQMINEYGRQTDGGTLINQRRGGGGLQTHTEESRAKIGMTQKVRGRPSPLRGRTLSDEHKARVSAALTGRKRKPFTEETKLKISLAHKGRTRTHTDETKDKIRQSLKGRPSPKKGKPLSDEHRAILSAKTKEYWARRKESSLK